MSGHEHGHGHEFNMTAALDMLYLSSCAAKGEAPCESRVSEMDLHALYEMCRFHSLSALVYTALEGVGAADPEHLAAFRTARDRSVRKNLMLDIERGRLCEFLEQEGIWYMPLKGIILKDMYPKMGARQMADNDILFDSEHRKAVKAWFDREGYETVVYGIAEEDAYTKAPIYNFEMHTELFNDSKYGVYYEAYHDVKKRLIKDAENGFGYHFSDEDFYIYFIAHGAKHYNGSGMGLRFLIDLYIFGKNKPDFVRSEYVKSELDKLGLLSFEERCSLLTETIFEDIQGFDITKLDADKREMLEYFLSCGTYGSTSVRVANGIMRKGRLGFIMQRLFPDAAYMKRYIPAVEKHRWLMPIAWLYRAVKQIPLKYSVIMNEFRMIIRK